MKNKIQKKLRSQTGASITFALLLFLVCAVLCSVIITAATVAAGRISRIAETDQKFFAVSSASEFLKDMIEEAPTVYVVEVGKSTLEYDYGSNPPDPETMEMDSFTEKAVYIIPSRDKVGNTVYKYDPIKITNAFNTENLLSAGNSLNRYNVNNSVDFKLDSIQKDAAKTNVIDKSSIPTPKVLKLSSTFYADAGLDFDAMAVDIREIMDASGNLTFTLYNTYSTGTTTSDAGNRYTMLLSFGVDKSTGTDAKIETKKTTAGSGSSHKVETVITKMKITTMTWTWTGRKINPKES